MVKNVLTPEDAAKRSQAAKSWGLRQAMLALTGQTDTCLSDIDQEIFEGEQALTTLLHFASICRSTP